MISVLVFSIAIAAASDQSACPMHEQHMKAAKADGSASHGAAVDGRHDSFGMNHASSHHSFRLFKDGGAIELRTNDPKDTAMIDVIRKHLREINAAFVKSDFSTPGFVHGYPPDGVAEMKRLSGRIRYRYEDVDSGGRIRMTSTDAKALAAIHDFMKFQVTEHRTDDSRRSKRIKAADSLRPLCGRGLQLALCGPKPASARARVYCCGFASNFVLHCALQKK